MQIFGNPKRNFGNVWAFTSRMVLHGIRNNEDIVYLSQHSKREGLIVEMWDCFDTQGVSLEVVDEPITTLRRYGVPEHKEPYASTKLTWSYGEQCHGLYGRVCYQIETKHNKRHPDKLFQGDAKRIIKRIEDLGLEVVLIGLPLTVSQIIKIAANSDCFIGICSGMSHVCHSVGVPVYLQNWNLLKKYHPNKKYKVYENEDDLLCQMKELYSYNVSGDLS